MSSNQSTPEYLNESMSPSTVRRGAFHYLLPAHGFVYLSEDVMEMKVCPKCKQKKSLELFFMDKSRKNGRQIYCRVCGNKKGRVYRKTESGIIAKKKHLDSKHGKKAIYKYGKKYRRTNPLKISSHKAVYYALSTGRLVKKSCSVCGSTINIEAHHVDYSKWLDVVWLCCQHHRDLHATL